MSKRKHRRPPIRIDKYEKGEFDNNSVEIEQIPEYEARIAALERLVGRQALEIEVLRTARMRTGSRGNESSSIVTGPPGSPSDEECGLMSLSCPTFYAKLAPSEDDSLVEGIPATNKATGWYQAKLHPTGGIQRAVQWYATPQGA